VIIVAPAKKKVSNKTDAEKPSGFITRHMKIMDVVADHPEAIEVMFKYGLHCVGCHVAQFESVEDGAKAHGMSDKDIDKMIHEMNREAQRAKAMQKE